QRLLIEHASDLRRLVANGVDEAAFKGSGIGIDLEDKLIIPGIDDGDLVLRSKRDRLHDIRKKTTLFDHDLAISKRVRESGENALAGCGRGVCASRDLSIFNLESEREELVV